MSKTAHELTRKEMKGPDKFQVAAADAATWAAKRQKVIVAGVLAVFAVTAVAIGISSYLEGQQAKAGGALYKALDAASGEISAVPLPNFDRPLYKTAEEKQKAVLVEAEKVRQRFGGSRAAVTAALVAADAQLALKDWDKAIASYQEFLDKAPADDALRFGALDGLARAQEGKGDLDAAQKTWEKAAAIPFFKDRAILDRARVLARAGKTDDAKKALEGVAKESPVAAEVQERLSRLGAK
jgi:tetratricopeptide (TPR) repeat protein